MTTKRYTQNAKRSLTLAWLYPELMSTYGDRGNIIVLQKIAEANGINLEIIRIDQASDSPARLASQPASQAERGGQGESVAGRQPLSSCDLLFMGGAQDLQQEIVMKDLHGKKGGTIKELIENGTPGLFICGAYQFMGNFYKDAYGNKIPGLGIFDMFTESFKTSPRLIGNIVIEALDKGQKTKDAAMKWLVPLGNKRLFVGFENHGGKTYLKDKTQAFAKVVKGFGNNGEDKTEGIHYKKTIGTYLHGPILPSNPELAVYLLEIAFKKKYGEDINIEFNNDLSKKAKQMMLKRLKIDN